MTKLLRLLLVVFLLCLLALAPALAQQGPSPLAGKTVHVYDPFFGTAPLIDLSGKGFPMTAEADGWFRFDFSSIGTQLEFWMKDFHFRTSDHQQQLGRTGLGQAFNFTDADFAAARELWILVDPHGANPKAAPAVLSAPPRLIRVLNPWPVSGPEIVLNGTPQGMKVNRAHCGWYTRFVLTPGALKAHFRNVADDEPFGKGGLGDAGDFDLAAAFAGGNEAWITDAGAVTSAYPGKDGTCSYLMAATVHDLAMTHPDFNPNGDGVVKGMVEATLGPDRKPVFTDKARPSLNTWFNSDPNKPMPLKGAETCVDIEMGKSDDGLWEYDSWRDSSHGYFPINDFNVLDNNEPDYCYMNPITGGYVNGKAPTNFGFCMESHATFIYKKGQVFEFRGDDDVWVFINNKLALDLGGVHGATPGTIQLDALGLEEGKQYNWDFFFCERKKCSSSLRIKTTIYFKQQRALDHRADTLPDGSVRYQVVKRVGGTGACGSAADSLKEVAPAQLSYFLYDARGTQVGTLKEGGNYGGIAIATPQVTVDTAKITGLPAGTYRLVWFEPATPKVQDEVRFTVTAKNRVELDPPYAVEAPAGSLVPVVAANRLGAALVAEAGAYVLVLPVGLAAFSDAAGRVPVAAGATLATGADGLDTVWVRDDTAALEDRTYAVAVAGSAKEVRVTFKLPPLDLPRVTAASIHDDDEDGIADRLLATYDRDISSALPKQAAWRWPAAATPGSLPQARLAALLAGGTALALPGPFTAAPATFGTGTFSSTYPARGRDSTQTVAVADRIAPILLSAVMVPGIAGDTLRLTFSEQAGVAAVTALPAYLFVYRASPDAADLRHAPLSLAWGPDGETADLVFPSGSDAAPRAGQLVRIEGGAGRIADAAGNTPGANSRFRLITGVKRSGIQTVTYRRIDPAFEGGRAAVTPSLEPVTATVEAVVERTGRMGHLVKVDLGDHALGDGFAAVDPSRVLLEYQAGYFTNHGESVASARGAVRCDDPVYQGDCRKGRGYLFVGWNYQAENGRKVGTGAYVASLKYKVIVAGRAVDEGSLVQTWGVLRSR